MACCEAGGKRWGLIGGRSCYRVVQASGPYLGPSSAALLREQTCLSAGFDLLVCRWKLQASLAEAVTEQERLKG